MVVYKEIKTIFTQVLISKKQIIHCFLLSSGYKNLYVENVNKFFK